MNNDAASRKMLVLDDEESILFAMKDYFTTRGFEVDTAQDEKSAREKLSRAHYSVVIIDLQLTVEDDIEGLEMVKHIRDCHPQTRVIVLTAYGIPEVENLAFQLGVEAFLHKPTPLAEVARIVSGLFKK